MFASLCFVPISSETAEAISLHFSLHLNSLDAQMFARPHSILVNSSQLCSLLLLVLFPPSTIHPGSARVPPERCCANIFRSGGCFFPYLRTLFPIPFMLFLSFCNSFPTFSTHLSYLLSLLPFCPTSTCPQKGLAISVSVSVVWPHVVVVVAVFFVFLPFRFCQSNAQKKKPSHSFPPSPPHASLHPHSSHRQRRLLPTRKPPRAHTNEGKSPLFLLNDDFYLIFIISIVKA